MKRRVSKAPIIFMSAVVFVFFCLLIFMFAQKKELADYQKVDFGLINLASDHCMVNGPDGRSIKEQLMGRGPGEAVVIPEGSVIVGECFVVKSKARDPE